MAKSLGLTVDDFNELEVSPVAVNVLFDALCESKNSLLPGPTCDERRAAMVDAETGGPDVTAFSIALIKARFLVIVSTLVPVHATSTVSIFIRENV